MSSTILLLCKYIAYITHEFTQKNEMETKKEMKMQRSRDYKKYNRANVSVHRDDDNIVDNLY